MNIYYDRFIAYKIEVPSDISNAAASTAQIIPAIILCFFLILSPRFF